jgi:prepilin-type N-terminal cleavage/methylation domain-containing protein
MLCRKGMTLVEIIVVLIIIGLTATFALPNFTNNIERSKAITVQNNLLAIYSAEQNYNNNNNGYCIATCDNIADINTRLSLNIQDDGSYAYSCAGVICTAQRTSINVPNTIQLTLNTPIQISANANPVCSLPAGWCP